MNARSFGTIFLLGSFLNASFFSSSARRWQLYKNVDFDTGKPCFAKVRTKFYGLVTPSNYRQTFGHFNLRVMRFATEFSTLFHSSCTKAVSTNDHRGWYSREKSLFFWAMPRDQGKWTSCPCIVWSSVSVADHGRDASLYRPKYPVHIRDKCLYPRIIRSHKWFHSLQLGWIPYIPICAACCGRTVTPVLIKISRELSPTEPALAHFPLIRLVVLGLCRVSFYF